MSKYTKRINKLQAEKDEHWCKMLAAEKHEAWHREHARKQLNSWVSANNEQYHLLDEELKLRESQNDA